jgi:hypothetical protein
MIQRIVIQNGKHRIKMNTEYITRKKGKDTGQWRKVKERKEGRRKEAEKAKKEEGEEKQN